MKPINWNELYLNRNDLIEWQAKQRAKKIEGIRLHLGSGHTHIPGYINVDPYTEESDCKDDMSHLNFKPESVMEIVSHHSLEHIPMRDVWFTLNHWYSLLAPGGTVEIGMPDVELCCQAFLESNEYERWTHYIWTIFGGQTADLDFNPVGGFDVREKRKFAEGQVHMAGFSLTYFISMLEDIGFKILKSCNYDANSCAPSLFVYAEKPVGVRK